MWFLPNITQIFQSIRYKVLQSIRCGNFPNITLICQSIPFHVITYKGKPCKIITILGKLEQYHIISCYSMEKAPFPITMREAFKSSHLTQYKDCIINMWIPLSSSMPLACEYYSRVMAIFWLSFIHNRNPYTDKMTSLRWNLSWLSHMLACRTWLHTRAASNTHRYSQTCHYTRQVHTFTRFVRC